MAKDRVYEKLLQHDKQLQDLKSDVSVLKADMSGVKTELTEVKDELRNFRVAVMDALDHLVVRADRVDKERLVTTYRIDTLDERVNQHDKEITHLKATT